MSDSADFAQDVPRRLCDRHVHGVTPYTTQLFRHDTQARQTRDTVFQSEAAIEQHIGLRYVDQQDIAYTTTS